MISTEYEEPLPEKFDAVPLVIVRSFIVKSLVDSLMDIATAIEGVLNELPAKELRDTVGGIVS